MKNVQSGILAPVPKLARYLTFSLKAGAEPATILKQLKSVVDGEQTIIGLGLSLILSLEQQLEGLHTFPAQVSQGITIPSTPTALWCWLRGDDRGELVHRTRKLEQLLAPAFTMENVMDAFQYGASLDLTGYEDGTENPVGEEAIKAGIVQEAIEGMEGSSFVAVQHWVHDMDRFETLSTETQDHTFGRRKTDNEELDDAPESAHVKRTAQESFDPEAFILRRSMPWADATRMGLVFVAFGHSFDAFEALLGRMLGKEDGIIDALFNFTHPITGNYYWCPPIQDGQLDLRVIGL